MSGIYRWNLNPFIALFLSFFFTKIRREVDKSLRKLGDIKADTHIERLERRLQENGLAWGVESYVTSQSKAAPLLALWPVFHARRWSFDTQSVLVHFLPNMCLRVALEVTLLEIPPCQNPMRGVAYSCSYVLLLLSTSHCRTFSIGTHTTVKVRLQEIVGSDRSLQKYQTSIDGPIQHHSRPKNIFVRTMCFGKAKRSQTKAFSVQWRKVSPLFRKVMALWPENYALSIVLSLATLFWCSLPFLKQQSITFFEIGIQSSSLPLFVQCKNGVLIC